MSDRLPVGPPAPAWESVTDAMTTPWYVRTTERLVVPGGWLYRTLIQDHGGSAAAVSTTFVPDPSNLAAKW
jgi:hypothetical protein